MNYTPVFRRMICLCWFCLGICFSIKLLGGDWFSVYVENEKFIAFCNWFDGQPVAQYVVGCLSTGLSMGLFWLAILRRRWFEKRWHTVLAASTILVGVAIRLLLPSLGIVVDAWQFFAVPMIIDRFKYKDVVCGFVLLVAFMVISNVTKNIPLNSVMSDSSLISMVYMIDLFIMLVLYYLYRNSIFSSGGE